LDLPLSQTVDDPLDSSLESIRQLAREIVPSTRIRAEVTEQGLLLRAVSELDLEIAVDRLKAVAPALRVGNPAINYIESEVWLEPFATIVLHVPAETLQIVCQDLRARRAEFHEQSEAESGQVLVRAIAPMAELFGYSTSLRTFTRGRGSFEQEFHDYRPMPTSGASNA